MNEDQQQDGGNSGQSNDTQAILKGLQNLINRQGGEGEAAQLLYRENRKLREERRELEDQLKAATLPEGTTPLPAERVALLESYEAFGTPDDIQARIKQLNTLERQQTVSTAATAAGYKPEVLARLATDLTLETKQETADGETVNRAYVVQDEGATPLHEYAKEHWGAFMPALETAAEQTQGVRVPRQAAGGKAPTASAVDRFLAAQQEAQKNRVNPLQKTG